MAERILGWRPNVTTEQGLSELIQARGV
jgi:hypothetical protein